MSKYNIFLCKTTKYLVINIKTSLIKDAKIYSKAKQKNT